ncbi:MAG TPA: type II toxin-antitoxin system VapC family toxin [Pirellulales bacterium]|jgi:predicted nucleic acid-binding protein
MAVLIDTCVLIPAFNSQTNENVIVRQALRRLIDSGKILTVTPQNIAEFWNVSTRPVTSNGRGLPGDQVRKMVNIICRVSRLEYETASSFLRWREIVERHGVQGVAVHDARLVATMLSAGIREILTRNEGDFRRYEKDGIEILTPHAVVAGAG